MLLEFVLLVLFAVLGSDVLEWLEVWTVFLELEYLVFPGCMAYSPSKMAISDNALNA